MKDEYGTGRAPRRCAPACRRRRRGRRSCANSWRLARRSRPQSGRWEMTLEFKPFGKIHRLNREVFITEKIDGTNALVYVADTGEVRAGSRTRWITPEWDPNGFAAWVREHADGLR